MKTLSIKDYSAMAVSLLTNFHSVGQVVHTDLDPDVIIDEPDMPLELDLDNNGLYDFKLLIDKGIFSTFGISYEVLYKSQITAIAGPLRPGADLVGFFVLPSSAAGGAYFVDALETGYLVHEDLSSGDYYWLSAAGKMGSIHRSVSTYGDPIGPWHLGLGRFMNDNLDSLRYIGIRFDDEAGCVHYGWIRCAVMDSVSYLKVTDYAYEQTCDKPIATGDTVSYVQVHEQTAPSVQCYQSGGNLILNLKGTGSSGSFAVYDQSGELVLSNRLHPGQTIIPQSLHTGIYVVRIQLADVTLSKKFAIF